MKLTEEIEEFINLTITEHMGKEYAEWKIKQQSVAEPDKVELLHYHQNKKRQLQNTVMPYSVVEQIQKNFFIVWD